MVRVRQFHAATQQTKTGEPLTMRRRRSSRDTESFRTVTVYLDDLEAILEAIRAAPFDRIVLASGDYEYESFDEIIDHRGLTLHDLLIEAESEESFDRLSVEIGRPRSGAVVSGSSVIAVRGVTKTIADILRSRHRWISRPLVVAFLVITPLAGSAMGVIVGHVILAMAGLALFWVVVSGVHRCKVSMVTTPPCTIS